MQNQFWEQPGHAGSFIYVSAAPEMILHFNSDLTMQQLWNVLQKMHKDSDKGLYMLPTLLQIQRASRSLLSQVTISHGRSFKNCMEAHGFIEVCTAAAPQRRNKFGALQQKHKKQRFLKKTKYTTFVVEQNNDNQWKGNEKLRNWFCTSTQI